MKLIFSSLIIIGGLIFGMAGCATGDAGARGNRADGGAGTTGESGSGGGKSGSGGSSAKGGSGGEDWLDENAWVARMAGLSVMSLRNAV